MIFGLDTLELIATAFVVAFVLYLVYTLLKRKIVEDFRANYESLKRNRSMYSDNMLRAYIDSEYDGNGQTAFEQDAHLLKPASDQGSSWDLFTRIDGIVLDPVFETTDFRGVEYIGCDHPAMKYWLDRIRCLPNPSRPFSYNIRRYIGKEVFNGQLYHILDVRNDQGSTINIRMGLSNYYSFFNSCEALSFLSVCGQNRVLERKMNRNSQYESRLKAETSRMRIDAGRFDNRCVSIGVCTLTVLYGLADDERMFFLVHKRSDRVAEAMNTISLVPAGTLQPNNINRPEPEISARSDIRYTIMREFEEEILGRKEVESVDEFHDEPVPGMAGYYLTMGLDPLTTKMEMVTMLAIDCSSLQVQSFLRRFIPDVGEGCIDSATMRRILDNYASNEGSVSMEPFDVQTVTRFERYSEAMPVFRECMRFVRNNFEEIEQAIKQKH